MIAAQLITGDKALRTRSSANGFFANRRPSLALTRGGSSRPDPTHKYT
jgi:hypothetical protein